VTVGLFNNGFSTITGYIERVVLNDELERM
jgi:hypothetical protein